MKASLCFALLALLSYSALAEGALRYGGAPLRKAYMLEAAAIFEKQYGTSISVSGGSTSRSFEQVLQGQLDLAGGGRFLSAEEKKQGLVETLVGWDALLPVVHMDNPLDDLTSQQLQGIFSGSIKNWAEVGGKNQPITVYAAPEESGTRAIMLDGENLTSSAQTVPSPSLAIAKINSDPSGIAMISKAYIVTQVRGKTKTISVNGIQPTIKHLSTNQYPFVRPLVLVTRGEPSGAVKKFVDFTLGASGQRIMHQYCFAVHEFSAEQVGNAE